MAIETCAGCRTTFAVGLLRCPRCQRIAPLFADRVKEDHQMPRITIAAGPTNAAALPGEVGYIEPEDVAGAEVRGRVEISAEEFAVLASGGGFTDLAEAPVALAATRDAEPAAFPAAAGSVPDYASMTVLQLREAAKGVGLPVGGSKADLVARLAAASETVGSTA